jgi:hypothetical protein
MQCLLHCFNCSWAKEANFLFNRNKPLFVINDYSATYVGTDHSSHLSRKCNLSTCSQRFHHQMQCSYLLHSENYSWSKHTDFLFNRNKPLFVINDYSATYVGTDRSSHLSRKCKLLRERNKYCTNETTVKRVDNTRDATVTITGINR